MWKIWDCCRRAAIFGLLCLCRVGFFFLRKNHVVYLITLPETSIAPENGWLEDYLFLICFESFFGSQTRARLLTGKAPCFRSCASLTAGAEAPLWGSGGGRREGQDLVSCPSDPRPPPRKRIGPEGCHEGPALGGWGQANKTKNSLSSCLVSYYAVTTRLFSFFECIYSIILFEIKHVYSCHVLFFVVLQYRMYRPILLLHIVIESRGLCVSQPIFLFLLSFPRFMSSRRCLEFYMQDPEHDWDLQIRLGLDIVQARWFHIVGVSFFLEQLIYTLKIYMNEWRLNICIQTPDLLTNQSDIPSMEPHLPYTTIYQ